MYILELILAIIQAVMNIALAICMIPFVPVVWVIREIKGVKPVTKDTMDNCPKIKFNAKIKKSDEI